LFLTRQPQSQAVRVGSNVTFSVSAASVEPPGYQWHFNGSPISGANSSNLTLTSVQVSNRGVYTVLVTNSYDSIMSDPATLSLLIRPVLLQHAQSHIVPEGSTISMDIAVDDTATLPMTNRWRKSGTFFQTNIMADRFTDSLVLSNVRTNDGDTYACIVGNVEGASAFSSNAYLYVVIPPTNQAVFAGNNATFTGQAAFRGTSNRPRYQWQFEGSNILNATNTTLTLTNVQTALAGNYTLLVSNPLGMTNGFSAELTVLSPKPRFLDPQISGSAFRAWVEAVPNRSYIVEFSSDLTNWTELPPLLMTNELTFFEDTADTNATQRFYRARLAE
jgi:hypothetical protein